MESGWCKTLTLKLMYQPTSKAHGKQELTLGVRFTAGSTACHFTFLSAYSLIRLSSVTVELCAHWTCKCFWDPIRKSAAKKFCAKNQEGFAWQQTWPHVGAAAAWIGAGSSKGSSTYKPAYGGLLFPQSWKCTWDWPRKYTGLLTAFNLYNIKAFRSQKEFLHNSVK